MKNILLSLALLVAMVVVFLYAQGILPFRPYETGKIDTKEILKLTNQTRKDHGLGELKENDLLTQAATAKAVDIFKNQYFQHASPSNKSFSNFIKETNYQANRLGENLAKDIKTAPGLVQSWLDSAPHRENLLNPYFQEIGLSVLSGELNNKKTTVVVQMFGEPKEKKNESF